MTVQEIVPSVTIGNQTVEPSSIRISREIATPLPHNVVGGGGIVKGTCEVEFVDQGTVLGDRHTPWNPSGSWPPERAQSASVNVTVNGESSRRFTGRISSLSGNATSPILEASLEDRAHLFDSARVSHEPLHRTMPRTTGGTSDRPIGLNADYMVEHILRSASIYVTPHTFANTLLLAPLQGSLWPRLGGLLGSTGTVSGQPTWHQAPWGWAAGAFTANYIRNVPNNWTIGNIGPLRIGVMVAPNHSAAATITTIMETGSGTAEMGFRVTADRSIEVRHNATQIGPTIVPTTGWQRVEMVREASQVIIRTDNGFEQSFNHTLGGNALNGTYARTNIQASQGSRIAGLAVQLAPPTYQGNYATQPLTAPMRVGSLVGTMQALPTIDGRDARDLLREISEATVCSVWFTREGNLEWWHPDRLRNQAPAAELTATADLIDLAWRDGVEAARSSVTTTYRYAKTRIRNTPSITVWEGNGSVLQQGETEETLISTPSDEDWLMVADLGAAMLATPGAANPQDIPDFNRGAFSWVGGSPMNADGETPGTLARREAEGQIGPGWRNNNTFPGVGRSLEQIGLQAWLITVTWQDIADNYWIALDQKLDIPGALNSRLNGSNNGQGLPILRARGRTWWEDREYTSSITGPSQYDALTHDV